MTAALRLFDPLVSALRRGAPPRRRRPRLRLAASGGRVTPVPVESPQTATGQPRLLPIDVVFGCADADARQLERTFPALHGAGCVPMLLAGLDYDPERLRDSLDAAGEDRLYVFVRTPALPPAVVQSLVDCFREHRSEGHRLLVLELRPERVYALVPTVRRAADRLRGGLAERRVERHQARAPAPWQTLVGLPCVGEPVPQRIPKPLDLDTSYCIHFLRRPPARNTLSRCDPSTRYREMPWARTLSAASAPSCARVSGPGPFSTCAG